MKTNKKNSNRRITKRPKNVWNSIRKLEGYIRKADIQASIFMDSLRELKEAVSFEVRADIVRKLCSTVNGDVLNALLEHRRKIETGKDGGNIEENAILLGVLEVLEHCLDLTPHKMDGERLRLSKESVREYDFDEYPEALDNKAVERFDVEVLRCGWKIGSRVVVKPKVFAVGSREQVTQVVNEG